MSTINLKCEICGKEAIGVASSVLGAISHAYCGECSQSDREVWSTLVGSLMGSGITSREMVGEWAIPIIEATCKFYNKTEAELFAEVKEMEKMFEADMANEVHHPQTSEIVFRLTSNSERHKLTITPTRISIKVAKNIPEDYLEFVEEFSKKLVEEEIDVGNSFRGYLDVDGDEISVSLRNSNKQEYLYMTYKKGDNMVRYNFKEVKNVKR